MRQVNLPLDYIIKVANNSEFPNEDSQIARSLISHFEELPELNLSGFVFVSSLSKANLINFYNRLGYTNFPEFVEDIFIGVDARKRQISLRYGSFDIAAVLARMAMFANQKFEDLDLIDKICTEISKSGRIVCLGAVGQTTLLQDFQHDLLLMKKEVVIGSIIEGHDVILKDDDLVFLFSASGRILYLAPNQFKHEVFTSPNQKVLFSQQSMIAPGNTTVLPTNAPDDYFTHRYVVEHYLDLIRVRYYELYGREFIEN